MQVSHFHISHLINSKNYRSLNNGWVPQSKQVPDSLIIEDRDKKHDLGVNSLVQTIDMGEKFGNLES